MKWGSDRWLLRASSTLSWYQAHTFEAPDDGSGQEINMRIEVTPRDQAAIAVITGEIDGKTAPQAQAELLPMIQQYSRVVLDMSGVTFLSSAGLRMLLLVYRQAAAKDGKVILVGLSEEIQDTMSMTGFLNFFTVADSVNAALTA